jgi:hypothetical protein
MQPQTPSPDPGAPAPASPDASPQVEIALGPNVELYPEHLRPAPEPAAPPAEDAPEPGEATVPEDVLESAGADASPQPGETRGTRRRAAEDAYQRGRAEERLAIQREQQQRAAAEEADRIQREAAQRVEQLFVQARSTDANTRTAAWNTILTMYDGNRQAQALMSTTRQQVLADMAADFATVKDVQGLADADYQQLYSAPSAAELVKRAIDIGKKSRDDQVAKLEAELTGVRGRLVGSRATPEATNGAGAPNLNGPSVDDYLAMSPKDAAKLSSAQIDAITAQLAADFANGRTQG